MATIAKVTQKRQADIAERVRGFLEENGMTQRELATKTGMKDSAISRILHAQTNLTLKTIGTLEDALGIRLLEIP